MNLIANDEHYAQQIRRQRAQDQAASYTFFGPVDGPYAVFSPSGAQYSVTATSCSCPDHRRRGLACKHMLMAQSGLAARQRREQTRKAMLILVAATIDLDYPCDP